MSIAPLLPRVSDYVAWRAEREPQAEAAVLGDQRWTYAELDARIRRLARALVAAGVAKGDRVATLQTPHPDYLVAFLATASIGAIWVGLNPKYRIDELRHVVTDCEPRVLLTRTRVEDREYAADIAALQAACPALERVVAFEGEPTVAGAEPMAEFLTAGEAVSDARLAAAAAGCGGRDPCLIVYTSGSTGRPKGALLHHEGVGAFSIEQNRIWPVSPHRSVNYFPINHVGCVVDLSMPAVVAGGCVIFMEHFDPAECLRLMAAERATLWGSVPSVFQMQLALPDFAAYDLSAVQLIIWEGAAMPEELIRRLLAVKPRLAANYGMTETTSAITVLAPTDDVEALANSVGGPFPGVEVRLVGPDGADVPDGQEGEIWARSRYNLLGYWRRPDETTKALGEDGFFRTGDLGVRRPDGRIRIVGRLKEMYKSGGYNVYPREVETVLESHPAVALAAVVARPDPVWQEVGVAYVAPRADVTASELDDWCRTRLANYKRPKAIVIEPHLPLLPIGKVDKAALKRRADEEMA